MTVPTRFPEAGLRTVDASLPAPDATVPVRLDASEEDGSFGLPDAIAPIPDGSSAYDGGLPSTAVCRMGGNILWLDGEPGSWWLAGTQLDHEDDGGGPMGPWVTDALNYYAPLDTYDEVHFGLPLPGASRTDPWWFLLFSTWQTGTSLTTGVTYTTNMNVSDGAVSIGASAIQIGYQGSDQATCPTVSGSFRFEDLVIVPGTETRSGLIERVTMTFAASCDEGDGGVLRGCIHFTVDGGP